MDKVNQAVWELWKIKDIIKDACFCSNEREWISHPLRTQLLNVYHAIYGAYGFSNFGDLEREYADKLKHEQD